MAKRAPRLQPLPKPSRFVSRAEWAWLNKYRREAAYDDYMREKRERWLWERPHSHDERS